MVKVKGKFKMVQKLKAKVTSFQTCPRDVNKQLKFEHKFYADKFLKIFNKNFGV